MSRILSTLLAASYAEQCQEDAPLMQVPRAGLLAKVDIAIDPKKGIDLMQADERLEPALYQLAKESDGPLSSEVQDVLDVIVKQIDELVKLTDENHEEDKGEMARVFGTVDTCNSVGTTDEARVFTARNTATAAGASHKACRESEVGKHRDTVDRCNTLKVLVTAKSSHSALDCLDAIPALGDGFPLQTAASVPESKAFIDCMEQIQNWAADLQDAKDKRDACNNAYDAYKAQVAQCRKDQGQFEADYCVYKAHSDEICGTLDTCHENAVKEAGDTCAAITTEVASRKDQHLAGKKIKCLATTLLSGSYSPNLSECDKLEDDSDKYNIPCPAAAEKVSCHRVAHQPGDEDWVAAEYKQETWIDIARNDVGSSESILSDVLTCQSPEAAEDPSGAPSTNQAAEAITSGDCASRGLEVVLDSAECKSIATTLGLVSDTAAEPAVQNEGDRPYGCRVQTFGQPLWINTRSTTSTLASTSHKVICKPKPEAATAYNWRFVGNDVCRGPAKSGLIKDYGPGGSNNNNVRLTLDECKAKCEEDATCKGIAYEPMYGNNENWRCMTTRDVSPVEPARNWNCYEKSSA